MSRNVDFSHPQVPGRSSLRHALAALCLALVALLLATSPGQAQDAAPAVDPAVTDPAAPAAVTGTNIDSDITQNTTWTKAGSPYNITNLIDVEAGATLTIEQGVTVVVGRASDPQWSFPLTVKGALVAQGTAAEPILFTGLRKEAGSWGGLYAGNTEQQLASITLNYVIMEYGGNTEFGDAANLELHTVVADINNSTFRSSKHYGVSVDYPTQVNLRNSNFTSNGVGAVIVDQIGPTFAMELTNLTASGNGVYNAVVYDSVDLDRAYRFKPTGLPYVLENGFSVDRTDEKIGELTIDPGIQVYVDTGFYVYGNLKARGTAAQPILLTGIKQQPAGWWGLRVSGGSAELDHVTIEYGGEDTEDWGGNLSVSSAVITVTNSILRNSGSHGLFSDGGSPDEPNSVKVSNTTITGSRLAAVVCADESCNYDFNNLTVNGNGTDGIVYRSFAMTGGTWRNLGLPYIIEGQGGVGDDAVLTIEPGVEVRMMPESSFAVHGVLSAVGTPDNPIFFTGATKQAGSWQGIQVDNGGVAELRYCDIGYGGNWGIPDGGALLMTQSSSLSLSNCRIHDSSSSGIMVVAGAKPTIRNNSIENNRIGLTAVFPLEQVDARFNWWGHASGPKHENNPNGQGQQIAGNVAFEPWLNSPDDTGGGVSGITVDLSGPGRFAPGQTVIYSIFYHNGTGAPIDNAVLRFGMPANATLLEASPGSLFFPERNHVFWKLGNLAHGGQGLLWVRVRFDWGLTSGLKAPTAAQLSGSNLPGPLFDVNEYLTYVPRTLDAVTDLSADQVNQLRGTSPELEKLYQQALADGFKYAGAERQVYSTGQEAVQVDLLRFNPQMSLLSLYLHNNSVVGVLVDGSSYTVLRDGKAHRYDMQSNSWAPATLGQLQAASTHDGISWGECVQNCIEEKLPGYIIKKKIKTLSDAGKAINCIAAASGDEDAYLGCAKIVGKVAKQLSPVSEGIDLGECNGECQLCEEAGGDCDNPNCHCCTEDKYRCDSGDWLYGSFGIDVVKVKRCNLDEEDGRGTYFAEEVIKVCALCEKCMLGGAGAPVCVAKVSNIQAVNTFATLVGLAAIQGAQDRMEIAASSDEECDECREAKDPNEMYGPEGDLLPGQLVTYQIAYENVGEAEAFDVFVANKLDTTVFDPATLQINDGGSYSAGAQTLFWQIGTLAPKGQAGSKGMISYSVRVRSNLPSGTAVVNQAIVHFPTATQTETPTNRLINLIKPLVADPQTLQTEAGKPLAITLSGKDAVNAALTFAIVDGPLYGTLSGSAPNLQYTPGATASGLDRIRFTVSNGTSTSVAADVSIRILPSSADVTGPAIKWTGPEAGEAVNLAVLLMGSDNTGNYYYPVVQAQFNEAVNAATVNSQTVIVTDAAGKVLRADVRYDGASDQMQLLLRDAPVQGQAYAVTITTGVKDLRGNPMPANYSWSFTIASIADAGGQQLFLPVVAR
jgi:parallel beta-helix repeat protein